MSTHDDETAHPDRTVQLPHVPRQWSGTASPGSAQPAFGDYAHQSAPQSRAAENYPPQSYPPQDSGQQYSGQQYSGPYGQPNGWQSYTAPSYSTQPTAAQDGAGYAQQYGQGYGYGQPYGYAPQTAAATPRPGSVVAAGVLGFLWAALGFILTLYLLTKGSQANDYASTGNQFFPGLGDVISGFAGYLFAMAFYGLLWTVLMIWGGIWAIGGRSRVGLMVGGSVAIGDTGFLCFLVLANPSVTPSGYLLVVIAAFAISIFIVAALCTRSAAEFFAAQRAPRTF